MCPIHHMGRSKKRMGDRLRFVTYRVKSFLWLDKEEGPPMPGFGFASDISEDGMGLFLDTKLPKGTPVRVALEEETNTPYRGVVAWCRRFSLDQRFHAQANLDYVLGVQLIFESESERQRYLMFYNDVRKRAASVPSQFKF